MPNVKQSAVSLLFVAILFIAPPVLAGGKISIGEDKWISLGVGVRSSITMQEDGAQNGSDTSFKSRMENMRIYLNGQMNEYLKFEINTECTDCTQGGTMIVLDAIGKFEFNQYFNVWAGRMLVPLDRAELSGPYFQSTYVFDRTPFYPSDFGNQAAGRFGRDDGINIWGAFFDDKRFTYVFGVFDGFIADANDEANQEDNALWAGRLSWNFWNVESNPGYYTSSTYYGTQGDILTAAFAFNYQEDGTGNAAMPADFWGYNFDFLMEKVLPNKGVFTTEAVYKVFDGGLTNGHLSGGCGFCPFEGKSWSAKALYLFPEKVGYEGYLEGQFQPYISITENNPSNHAANRKEWELGTNYIIDGHNARISAFYAFGDMYTKGRNWGNSVTGKSVNTFVLALQWQL